MEKISRVFASRNMMKIMEQIWSTSRRTRFTLLILESNITDWYSRYEMMHRWCVEDMGKVFMVETVSYFRMSDTYWSFISVAETWKWSVLILWHFSKVFGQSTCKSFGGFLNWGYPQIINLSRIFPLWTKHFGNPPFQEPPPFVSPVFRQAAAWLEDPEARSMFAWIEQKEDTKRIVQATLSRTGCAFLFPKPKNRCNTVSKYVLIMYRPARREYTWI